MHVKPQNQMVLALPTRDYMEISSKKQERGICTSKTLKFRVSLTRKDESKQNQRP